MTVAAEPLAQVRPERPAPLRLYDEPWKACGQMVCLKPAEAQRSLENKVEIRSWMRKVNDLLDYYESLITRTPETPDAPSQP